MKSGEKNAMWFVLIGFALVAALTVYMELEHRKGNVRLKVAKLANEDLKNVPPGLGTAVIPKGIVPESLPDPDSRGATILVLYCAQCHELPTPLMHTSAEWEAVLSRMQQRMRVRRGGMLSRMIMPPKRDWLTLSEYLAAYGQKPLDPASADLATPEGHAFQTTCSGCHAMPDPHQHTAKEWGRVMARMRANMRAAKKPLPDAETSKQVISYLQQHSS
jgi:hypothetical protein